jgi:GT2 family glycosyltransferase
MPTTPPRVTILITTRDRKDELRAALRSCDGQSVPVEVLVVDDASTDGTPDMVRAEFPHVRLEASAARRGYIVQRNRGAALAAAPVVLSIDDDAVLSGPRIAEQAEAAFDHPRVAAATLPYVDVNLTPGVIYQPPPPPGSPVLCAPQYIGTAHALRRDVFLALGGYREALFHFNEEVDYAVRLYDAGYVVRVAGADPVHHLASPKREASHAYVYRARNRLLYGWHNVPFPQVVPDLAGGAWNLLRAGRRAGHVGWVLRGLGRGVLACAAEAGRRRPVRPATYRLFRRLREAEAAVPLSELEPLLPPPRFAAAAAPGAGRPRL